VAFILAAIFFAVALVLYLTGGGGGHLDVTTFGIAGLICLALAGVPAWPWQRR